MFTDNTATLYHAAIKADDDWQDALNRAGVERYTFASSRGCRLLLPGDMRNIQIERVA